MRAISRPAWIALLLVMAALAVARNLLFFTDHGASRGTVAGATIEGPAPAPNAAAAPDSVVTPVPADASRPARRIAAWRMPAAFPGDLTTVRDPFHLPPPPASSPVYGMPSRQPAAVGPELRILLTSGQRQVAMVDSQIVAPGDVVGGRRVAAITADGLRLTGCDGETRIELPPITTDQAGDDLP